MARVRIMIAASDSGFAGGLAATLGSLGYAVTDLVFSPEEALQKAEETRPDLVLLDLGMLADGGKGKAAQEIRERGPDLVFLLGEEDPQTLKQAGITHSFEYLRKTGDSRELETIIDMAFYRRKLEENVLKANEAQIRKQSAILDAFFQHAVTPLVILDAEFNFIRVNEAYARACAREVAEFSKKNHFELYPSDAQAIFEEVVATKQPYQAVARPFVFPDHPEWGVTYWDWTLVPLLDQKGEVEFLVFSLNDMTAPKNAEIALQRSNRALRTLSAVNKAVARADTEMELLQNVCRTVVEEGGYRLAWIGYAENDPGKTVRPMAQAGFEEGYLATLKITWADTERGRGPTGTAIRTGRSAMARNIPTDPAFAPWREEALKRGYASSLVLPLVVDSAVLGALNIYAGEADAFDREEVKLLSDLAADITFGIMAMRAREERRQMAAALRRSSEELEARVQARTQDLAQSNAALQNEISEGLWSEKKLRESEERYRGLVDLSPDAIAVHSQGRYVFVNPAGARLFGAADPLEIVGRPVLDLVHPDHRDAVKERIRKVTEEGGPTELRETKILRLDGDAVEVESAATGIIYQGRPAVQVVVRDITARKRFEEKLARLASFPQLNPNPVLEVNAAGSITYYNAATLQALEKQGLKAEVSAFLPPDVQDIIKTAEKTGETVFHREVTIKEMVFGETIYCSQQFKVVRIYASDITERKRAEEALRQSEEQTRRQLAEIELIYKSAGLGLCVFDRELRYVRINERLAEINGVSAEKHIGHTPREIIPDLADQAEELLHRILETGQPVLDIEFKGTTPAQPGVLRTWVEQWVPIKDSQGNVISIGVVAEEITERKEAEETLQVSRDFLEIANRHTQMAPLLRDYVAAVKEHTGCEAVAIRILKRKGKIPYEAHAGFSEEFIGCESPLSITTDQCLCINVIKGATDPSLPFYTPGSSFYINQLGRFFDAMSPEERSRTRGACHREGFESVALVPIFFGKRILGLIQLADRRENMVPLSLVARLERIALQLGTAINRVHAEETMRRALADSRQRQKEIAALLRATRAVLESRTFPEISRSIYDSCKDLIGATSGYVALLTADGRENEVLFLDMGGLQCTVDRSLPMPVRGLRAEAYRTGNTVFANDFADSEFVEFLPPGHVGLDNVLFAPLMVKGETVGLLGLGNKPGGYTENDARLAAGFGELAAMVLANKRAEEERERLIRELETEQARLQAIIASAPEAIVVADADGRILLTNPAAERLYARPVHDGAKLENCALFRFCLADGAACPPDQQPLLSSAKEGRTHRNLEMAIAWPDGQRRDLLVNTAPITDPQGRISGAVGLYQDITLRKRAEEKIRKLNAELHDRILEVSERTRQLEAANQELEAFSYSVSHDLRSPLRAIEGFARILMEDWGEKLDEEGVRLLNVIRNNTQTMGQLIDDLLALSRLGRQELRLQEIDLEELAAANFQELQAQAPERQMQLVLNPLPPARGDRNLINQVLVNLLENAVKFTKPREKAIIEVGGWTEGKENIYYIKDNGVGFDMRYVNKVFGVFQRLHPRGEFEGTGVGLAIVQRIINRHGGRVWATGKVDSGAIFYFALPRKGEASVK